MAAGRRRGDHGERAGGEERDARRAPPEEEVEHEQDERPERERHLRPEPERGAQVLVDEEEDSIAVSLRAYSGRMFWMRRCRLRLMTPRIACR